MVCLRGSGSLSGGSNYFKIVLPPFRKGVYSKRKEFAPLRSNFFSFRFDPFSKGTWCAGKQTGRHKYGLPLKKKRRKIYEPVYKALNTLCLLVNTFMHSVLTLLIKSQKKI